VDGTIEEDPNSSWPFFTLLDAIASGKSVAITSPGLGTFPQAASGPATPNSASATTTNSSILHAASGLQNYTLITPLPNFLYISS
jgi:hypothetical protein